MLTRADLEDIRASSFADDVDIPTEATSWSAAQAEAYFASGGTDRPTSDEDVPAVDAETRSRNAWALALGACLPNAPIPTVPLQHHGTAMAVGADDVTAVASDAAGRIFCVSDLHTDHAANMDWCRALSAGGFDRDVLIVAGDTSSSHVLLEETLRLLVDSFAHVWYVPGNHDLWVKGTAGPSGGLHVRASEIDSIQRLHEVLQLCHRLGVHTQPGHACGAIIVRDESDPNPRPPWPLSEP